MPPCATSRKQSVFAVVRAARADERRHRALRARRSAPRLHDPPALAASLLRCPRRGRNSRFEAARQRSCQPPLATPIVLHFAKAPPSRRRQSQIELLHVLVLREIARFPV